MELIEINGIQVCSKNEYVFLSLARVYGEWESRNEYRRVVKEISGTSVSVEA